MFLYFACTGLYPKLKYPDKLLWIKNLLSKCCNIRNDKYLGPKTGDYPIGERVAYALEKGLIIRSDTGSFIITGKGAELLDGKLGWESL